MLQSRRACFSFFIPHYCVAVDAISLFHSLNSQSLLGCPSLFAAHTRNAAWHGLRLSFLGIFSAFVGQDAAQARWQWDEKLVEGFSTGTAHTVETERNAVSSLMADGWFVMFSLSSESQAMTISEISTRKFQQCTIFYYFPLTF